MNAASAIRASAGSGLLVVAVLGAACGKARSHPTAGCPDVRVASAAPSASSSAAPDVSDAPTAGPPPDSALAPAQDAPYLSGRTWIDCADGFRAQDRIDLDVLRLGLLCGPYHGMKLLGETLTGQVRSGEPPKRFVFPALRDQCFRVFVVTEVTLQRVGLRMLGPGGAVLAAGQSDGRWAMLRPDGAVCVERKDTFNVEIQALDGHGAFALQIWLLR